MTGSGTRLAGRFELGELLGTGATASVRRGRDLLDGAAVAIKLIPAAGRTPEDLARFAREAEVLVTLDHPRLLRLVAHGRDGEVLYLVYPFVEGTPVDRLAGGSRLAPEAVAALVDDWLEGLAYLGDRGLVHRDLKPGNLMRTREGRGLVLDFGLARAMDDDPLTRTGMILGTPGYMAPELLEGRPASPASDLYALGVVGYELLAGKNPFETGDVPGTLRRHRDLIPAPLAGVPEALGHLVARLLAKDPAARPATAAQARVELASARAAPGGPDDPARTLVAAPGASPGTGPAEPGRATRRWAPAAPGGDAASTRKVRLPGRLGVGVFLLGLAFLATLAGLARDPPPVPGPPSPGPERAPGPPELPERLAVGLPGMVARLEAALPGVRPVDRADPVAFRSLLGKVPELRDLMEWLAMRAPPGALSGPHGPTLEAILETLGTQGFDTYVRPLAELTPRQLPTRLLARWDPLRPELRADPGLEALAQAPGTATWTGAALAEALAARSLLDGLDRALDEDLGAALSGRSGLLFQARWLQVAPSAESLLYITLRLPGPRTDWIEWSAPLTAQALRGLAAAARAFEAQPEHAEALAHLLVEALDRGLESALRVPFVAVALDDLLRFPEAPAPRLLYALLKRVERGSMSLAWSQSPPPPPPRRLPPPAARPRLRPVPGHPTRPELEALVAAAGPPVDGPLAVERRGRARFARFEYALDVGRAPVAAALFRQARDEAPDSRGPWRAALFARAMTGLTSHPELLDPVDLAGIREGAAGLLPELEDPALAAATRRALEAAGGS